MSPVVKVQRNGAGGNPSLGRRYRADYLDERHALVLYTRDVEWRDWKTKTWIK